MENFTNETIDTSHLPQFEEVAFTSLHPQYFKIILIHLALAFTVAILGFVVFFVLEPELFSQRTALILGVTFPIIALLVVAFAVVGFKKTGFAFREHDVLYRSGVIATNTIVIPYNRVQHVALHEGLISRFFGLATIEIFTAGGSSSDITIPGIKKAQAENIKQLLMGKIQKQL